MSYCQQQETESGILGTEEHRESRVFTTHYTWCPLFDQKLVATRVKIKNVTHTEEKSSEWKLTLR